MIRKRMIGWQIAGFLWTSVAGTLLHFLYEWSGNSLLIAPFSAVNESAWEHMKLLFFPMLLFSWAESRVLGKRFADFWWVKLCGSVLGLLLIPTLYYTYTGAFGVSLDWANISIFFVSAAATYFFETRLFQRDRVFTVPKAIPVIALLLPAAAFVLLTFWPPHIPLFQDPLTMTYGI